MTLLSILFKAKCLVDYVGHNDIFDHMYCSEPGNISTL